MEETQHITRLLRRSRTDTAARTKLYGLIYRDLRRVAGYRIAASRPGQTLSITALVNETYLKLTHGAEQDWRDRGHFLRVAATAMRQITIDYMRAKRSSKRASDMPPISFDAVSIAAEEKSEMVLALEDGLLELATENPRLVHVVECRFFAGMSIPETAAALDVSESTIERDWREARSWLKNYLT